MQSQHLTEMIEKLSAEQQTTVEKFIEHLQSEDRAITFEDAMESFIRDHHELLRRLAQ